MSRLLGAIDGKLHPPDVIHSTYYSMCPFPKAKLVITAYDFIDENSFATMSGNRADFIDRKRRSLEAADAVIAISEATRNDILKYCDIPADKVLVSHCGISDFFRDFVPDENDANELWRQVGGVRPFWLFVGRRLRYKNFNTVLRGWADFEARTGMGTQLVAVGPDVPLEEEQVDFLIRHRLVSSFHLLANVSDRLLAMCYRLSQAFIFSSLFEGFGIPLVEAMACGCPVIASDIPVFREIGADAASFFDPHDASSLADAMEGMLEEDLRGSLIGRGKERQGRYTWEAAGKAVAEVYRLLGDSESGVVEPGTRGRGVSL